MKTTATGRSAETAVADFIRKDGFKILATNWRTRWCEIDVIAQKAKTVYFIEVKYRVSDTAGSGFEYITAKKIQQMRFAADFWSSQNDWRGDSRLLGAEVTGPEFGSIELIEIET